MHMDINSKHQQAKKAFLYTNVEGKTRRSVWDNKGKSVHL